MNKFFSSKMKSVGKLIVVFAVLMFLWIMSSTVSPIKPHRLEKYPLCYISPPSHINFVYKHPTIYFDQPEFINFCKFHIPEIILYKALTLNVTYKLSQPGFFGIGIHREGMGPSWKPVEVNSSNTNKIIASTWLLNETDLPKLNWLSGSYEEVVFQVSKFDSNKELILSVYEVYLE